MNEEELNAVLDELVKENTRLEVQNCIKILISNLMFEEIQKNLLSNKFLRKFVRTGLGDQSYFYIILVMRDFLEHSSSFNSFKDNSVRLFKNSFIFAFGKVNFCLKTLSCTLDLIFLEKDSL